MFDARAIFEFARLWVVHASVILPFIKMHGNLSERTQRNNSVLSYIQG